MKNENKSLVIDEMQFKELTKASALLDTSDTMDLGSMKVGNDEYKVVYQRDGVFFSHISVIGTALQEKPVGSITCPVTRELLNAFLEKTFDSLCKSTMELPQDIDFHTKLDDMQKNLCDSVNLSSPENFYLGSASLGNIMVDFNATDTTYTGQYKTGDLKNYDVYPTVFYGISPEEATENTYSPDQEFPYEEYSNDACPTVPATLFLEWDEDQYRQWVTDMFKELIVESPTLLLPRAECTDRFWQRRDEKEKSLQSSKEMQEALDKVRQATETAAISVPVKDIQRAFFDGLAKAGREKEAILPAIQSMTAGKAPRKMVEQTLSLMGASQEAFGPMLDAIGRKRNEKQAALHR